MDTTLFRALVPWFDISYQYLLNQQSSLLILILISCRVLCWQTSLVGWWFLNAVNTLTIYINIIHKGSGFSDTHKRGKWWTFSLIQTQTYRVQAYYLGLITRGTNQFVTRAASDSILFQKMIAFISCFGSIDINDRSFNKVWQDPLTFRHSSLHAAVSRISQPWQEKCSPLFHPRRGTTQPCCAALSTP